MLTGSAYRLNQTAPKQWNPKTLARTAALCHDDLAESTFNQRSNRN
jgi:hypothetical protein